MKDGPCLELNDDFDDPDLKRMWLENATITVQQMTLRGRDTQPQREKHII